MSRVTTCPKCGGRMEVPAYPGDGVYSPPHQCPDDLGARLASCAAIEIALRRIVARSRLTYPTASGSVPTPTLGG